jgi:peroxiredoxin
MPLPDGGHAPAFSLPSADGGQRSLDELAGSGGALLAFFKTTCPVCTLAFPVYAELERRYGDALPVVAVSQDPPGTTVPWLEKAGFAGPALDDASDGFAVSKAYEIVTVPTLVLVEDGKVVSSSEGWDRERVNDWARDLGQRTGRDTSPVSTEDDGRPPFRPG